MPLDEWQEYALEAAMGERADGRWVSKFVGISAPRQNGKSQLIVARALAGVLLFGEKMIIISAHETDTAREIWKRLLNVVEDNPSLEARVTGRMDAINREFLTFGNGADKQTIKLKARRKAGSRGFSADCLLLDEAQILDKPSWGAIVPTMSAMPNPQMWLFGTPPTDEDDPFAFSRVRESSLAKKPRHAWLEWSADPGDDPNSSVTWAKANPAYGVRISREACADDRAAMDDDQFALERLGMWRSTEGKRPDLAVPAESWASAKIPLDLVPADPPEAFALSMSSDRTAFIAVAVGDHVELAERDRVDDTEALVEWFVQRCGRRLVVMIDARDPAASLVGELRRRKVKVNVTTLNDMGRACGVMVDALRDGRLTHSGQADVDDAVAVAQKAPIGKAGLLWEWDLKATDAEMAPLRAVTLARFSLTLRKPGGRSGRVVTV